MTGVKNGEEKGRQGDGCDAFLLEGDWNGRLR